jgi:hypothetical protein
VIVGAVRVIEITDQAAEFHDAYRRPQAAAIGVRNAIGAAIGFTVRFALAEDDDALFRIDPVDVLEGSRSKIQSKIHDNDPEYPGTVLCFELVIRKRVIDIMMELVFEDLFSGKSG